MTIKHLTHLTLVKLCELCMLLHVLVTCCFYEPSCLTNKHICGPQGLRQRHDDARHSHHHVPPCLLYPWRKRESVVGCHGVTAVLWVTAVIIMQLTEGTAAKTLRLLPKHHNTGGSMPAVMCWTCTKEVRVRGRSTKHRR